MSKSCEYENENRTNIERFESLVTALIHGWPHMGDKEKVSALNCLEKAVNRYWREGIEQGERAEASRSALESFVADYEPVPL